MIKFLSGFCLFALAVFLVVSLAGFIGQCHNVQRAAINAHAAELSRY